MEIFSYIYNSEKKLISITLSFIKNNIKIKNIHIVDMSKEYKNEDGGYIEYSENKFIFKKGNGGWIKRNLIYPNSDQVKYTWIHGDGSWIENNEGLYEWKPSNLYYKTI